ncbi:hypothetical protein HDR58_10055 [bacterium]|nr:hypothetical protein [bacterium]
MGKFKIFLLSVTPLIIILAIGCFIWFNHESIKIKAITKNLKVIDMNEDHNQALDVIDYAKSKNIEIPKTIINFDTHSDMFITKEIHPKYGADIYEWLNEYFAKNPNAEELYYIMPIEEARSKKMQQAFIEKDVADMVALYGNSIKDEKNINPHVDKIPFIQYFVIDTNNGYMTEYIEEKDKSRLNNPRYKKIKIITCTEKTLPDFKNKNVVLSIDFDYISNSGFDTIENFKNNKTPLEIKLAISKMLSTMKKKNIRPEIISLTLSPFYVPDEDIDQIYNFMEDFIKYSGQKDALKKYTYKCEKPRKTLKEERYEGF